ncbi:MAG: HAD family hydrolase [Actinobacteria bacterium]|nr:HAD family hydrolase [Actinomycetota bacterium]
MQAVTFDFWNTLIREDHGQQARRIDAWLGVFEGEGLAVERERLHAAFASTWEVFGRHWEANLVYGARDAVGHVLGELGLVPPAGVVEALVEVLVDPPRHRDPRPTDNVAEVLGRLHDAGLRIGIICDVGFTPSRTLRRYLDGHGLLRWFHHWSFSD